ncbi:MAG: helix-turn-helix transcriptional regulator [Ruminiclostridium sp.]|nr:helix-turn-helix transcriptional regulator [Ruminiclostridium sp.]
MTIGSNIKKLRTGQGLTQDQLAERLFVTRQTVSNWERGASQPDLEQLEAIAVALGVEVMELLYGPKERFRISRKRVLIAVGLLVLAAALWAGAILYFEPLKSTWYRRMHNVTGWYWYRCGYMTVTVLLSAAGLMTLITGLAPIQLEKQGRRACLIVGSVFGLVSLLGWMCYLAMVFTGWPDCYELFVALIYMESNHIMYIAAAFSCVFLFLGAQRRNVRGEGNT